ncbi:poor homologous synapsis 1, partial [Striga asiatica]
MVYKRDVTKGLLIRKVEAEVATILFADEHYVTKMNFSWPQVPCISGFPARGSRKICSRFSINHDSEAFMALVKEVMESQKIELPAGPVFKSNMSSKHEVTSSNEPAH